MEAISDVYEISYKEWLGRGCWEKWEAACIFSRVDTRCNRTHHSVSPNSVSLPDNATAQAILAIIETWLYGVSYVIRASPFWFINKALKEKAFEIPDELLKAVNEYYLSQLGEDREAMLKDYVYIAGKLNLKITDMKIIPPYLNENDINFAPEIYCAITIHQEITKPPYSKMKRGTSGKVNKWIKENSTIIERWKLWGIKADKPEFEKRMSIILNPMKRKNGGSVLAD